jgi:acyl-coenzyme A synthetase/AMP-(fatty) acid ligase
MSFTFKHPAASAPSDREDVLATLTHISAVQSQDRKNLVDMWEKQATKYLHSSWCIIDQTKIKHSYMAIYERVNHFIIILEKIRASHGISKTIVGISMNVQNAAEIVALLACLTAGLPFLPLPPTDVLSSRETALESLKSLGGKVGIIVTCKNELPGGESMWGDRIVLELNELGDVSRREPSHEMATSRNKNNNDFSVNNDCKSIQDIDLDDDVLYVLRTSGTTGGNPKFVKGLCSSTLSRLKWQWETLPFGDKPVVVRRSPLVIL